MIKVSAVQFNHRAGDAAYNLARINHFCQKAAAQQVQLIAFPEMCVTGYWHVRKLPREEIEALAEMVPHGPTTQYLSQLAQRHKMLVGAGLIEKTEDGRLFNTYILCDRDGTVHSHRKIHCFINEHISSGDSYTVFDTSLGYKVGILICYDNNIIENVRVTALMGADILLAPHQTGGCRSRSPHAMSAIDLDLWRKRQRDPLAIEAEFRGPKGREWLMRWLPSRAHDNGLFLVFSNGVGIDDDEVRTGNAMIIDCYGRILIETWKAQDDMVTAELDMSLLQSSTGRRWSRGRKPNLYGRLTEVTGEEIAPRAARFSA
jgi:predicted amidohydrolase